MAAGRAQPFPSLNLSEDLQKRLIEAQVRITKGKLSNVIKSSNGNYTRDDCLAHIRALIDVHCDLLLKYSTIPITDILRESAEKETLTRVVQAFSILEKYGRNLLRPTHARPPMWRSVMFANGVFSDKVDWMVGGREILRSYGYTVQIPDGVSFPGADGDVTEPDATRVAGVTADILMAREEAQLYLEGRHPHPELIEEHLPRAARVLQNLPHNAFESFCDTLQSVAPNIPTSVPTINHVEERNDAKYPAEIRNVSQAVNPLSPFSGPVTLPAPAVPVMKPAAPSPEEIAGCDICGKEDVLLRCDACDAKVLCRGCDATWHKHPKRSTHQRTAANVKKPEVKAAAVSPPRVETQKPVAVPREAPNRAQEEEEGQTQKSEVIRVIPGKGRPGIPRNELPALPIFDRTLTNTSSSSSENPTTIRSNLDLQSQIHKLGIYMQSGGQHAKELPAQNPPQMAQRAEVAPSESGGVAPAAQVKPTIREILSIPNFELKRIKLEALVIMTTTEMKQMEENLQLVITHEPNFLESSLYQDIVRKKAELLRELQIYESYRKMFEEEEKVRRLYQESEDDAAFHKSIRPPPGEFYIPPTTRAASEPEGFKSASPVTSPAVPRQLGLVQTAQPQYLPQTGSGHQVFESSPWNIATNVLGVNTEYKGACPKCAKITNYYNDVCHHCKKEIPMELKLEVLPSPVPITPSRDSPAPGVAVSPGIGPQGPVRIGEGARPKGGATAAVAVPTTPTTLPRENKQKQEQHAVATLRRNQSSESRFGVHPKRWICEHCTFENEAQTRVCLICEKTSDAPKYVDAAEENVTDDDKLSGPMGDGVGPKNIAVNFQQDAEQMAKEKKKAREEFKRMMEEEERKKKGGGAVVEVADGGTSMAEGDEVDASFTDARVEAGLRADSAHAPRRQETPDVNVNVDTAAAAKRRRYEKQLGDVAAKKREETELMSRETIKLIRLAENQGFTFDELDLSLKHSNDVDALSWLRDTWRELIGRLMSLAPEAAEQPLHGQISEPEARRALVETSGHLEGAVEKCVSDRKHKISELAELSDCSPEDASAALASGDGDVDDALEVMAVEKLTAFGERLWAGEDDVTSSSYASSSSMSFKTRSFQRHMDAATEATIMDRDVPFERRARMVLVEGRMAGWGRAENVLRVLEALPHDLAVTPTDVVDAVANCGNVADSLRYLMQECEICYTTSPISKMMSLPLCQCKMCMDCVKGYFEVQVKERHAREMVCPVCAKPDLQDELQVDTHFTFISLLLRSLIAPDLNDLFHRKLTDWKLMQDPNFRWCSHCACGFLFNSEEGQLRMKCPDCNKFTCFGCKKPWERQHEGLTCEEFATWKTLNDPEHQAAGLARHLEENGIDCPECKFRYALAKGGCMHFKCTQCRHEFCSGCSKPFKRGENCTLLRSCARAGLHCHHPRDCLFYLRDFDVQMLQKLLQDNNVEFDTERPAPDDGEGDPEVPRCPVMEQKELPTGYKDEACGKDAPEGSAGLCQLHYKEYIVYLINKHNIDPLVIMTEDELRLQCTRFEKNVPNKRRKESAQQYRQRVIQFIQREIPLPVRRMSEE